MAPQVFLLFICLLPRALQAETCTGCQILMESSPTAFGDQYQPTVSSSNGCKTKLFTCEKLDSNIYTNKPAIYATATDGYQFVFDKGNVTLTCDEGQTLYTYGTSQITNLICSELKKGCTNCVLPPVNAQPPSSTYYDYAPSVRSTTVGEDGCETSEFYCEELDPSKYKSKDAILYIKTRGSEGLSTARSVPCRNGYYGFDNAYYPDFVEILRCSVPKLKCTDCKLPPFVFESETISSAMKQYAPKITTSKGTDDCDTYTISCELLDPAKYLQMPLLSVRMGEILSSFETPSIDMTCRGDNAIYLHEGTPYTFDSALCADTEICATCTFPSFVPQEGLPEWHQYGPILRITTSLVGCDVGLFECQKLDPAKYGQEPELIMKFAGQGSFMFAGEAQVTCHDGKPSFVGEAGQKYEVESVSCRTRTLCSSCTLPRWGPDDYHFDNSYLDFFPATVRTISENGEMRVAFSCFPFWLDPNIIKGIYTFTKFVGFDGFHQIPGRDANNFTLPCVDGYVRMHHEDIDKAMETFSCVAEVPGCETCADLQFVQPPDEGFFYYAPTVTETEHCKKLLTCDVSHTPHNTSSTLLILTDGQFIPIPENSHMLCRHGIMSVYANLALNPTEGMACRTFKSQAPPPSVPGRKK
ncbi:unnamed protein product [Caenorhabditis auriculariae]|uniref:Uncharacterized protein n=1 Tax=Caenorhabditis auriculariae TaxID=2777116 RepID=A0A8S1HEH0_9PELO|nr:unnamed protein product [Caenorhabditis auriculariae]